MIRPKTPNRGVTCEHSHSAMISTSISSNIEPIESLVAHGPGNVFRVFPFLSTSRLLGAHFDRSYLKGDSHEHGVVCVAVIVPTRGENFIFEKGFWLTLAQIRSASRSLSKSSSKNIKTPCPKASSPCGQHGQTQLTPKLVHFTIRSNATT